MNKNVIYIQPDTKISKALKIINDNNLKMLPVCENKLFIGMLQKELLTKYELDKKNDNYINNLDSRILGNYHLGKSKKTILFICGVHGNELSGKIALTNIFKYLEENSIEINGNIIGLK